MLSKEANSVACVGEAGIVPEAAITENNETRLKPTTLDRAVGTRVEGDEIAADPVPVRRPGVLAIGDETRVVESGLAESQTGNTNIGSNLKR